MSKYTLEQVEDYAQACALIHKGPVIAEMLRDYAAHLRERESAKVSVTELCTRNPAPHAAPAPDPTSPTIVVTPMLASARVTEREALEAIKRLPAHPFPDPVAHSWEAFGRSVMGAFTDAKFIAIRALVAAPKPETEE